MSMYLIQKPAQDKYRAKKREERRVLKASGYRQFSAMVKANEWESFKVLTVLNEEDRKQVLIIIDELKKEADSKAGTR